MSTYQRLVIGSYDCKADASGVERRIAKLSVQGNRSKSQLIVKEIETFIESVYKHIDIAYAKVRTVHKKCAIRGGLIGSCANYMGVNAMEIECTRGDLVNAFDMNKVARIES